MLHFTKAALAKERKEKLTELVSVAGSVTHLAKMLNTPYSTVQGWIDRERISKDGAKKVSEHPVLSETFKAEDLRPDL